jgi:sec-independent protein translocase protein TatB
MSFGELVLCLIVAIVVIGPRDLPKMLRRAGQWAGKIRRTAAELRAQSGIDDILRAEGLSDDIAEIRKLARGEIEGVMRAARQNPFDPLPVEETRVERDREYPRDGADSYGALPDTAIVYAESLPASAWADDPLYTRGQAADPEAVPPVTTSSVPANPT